VPYPTLSNWAVLAGCIVGGFYVLQSKILCKICSQSLNPIPSPYICIVEKVFNNIQNNLSILCFWIKFFKYKVTAASEHWSLTQFFPQRMPKSLFFMYTYIQIPFTIMLLINATSNNNANILYETKMPLYWTTNQRRVLPELDH